MFLSDRLSFTRCRVCCHGGRRGCYDRLSRRRHWRLHSNAGFQGRCGKHERRGRTRAARGGSCDKSWDIIRISGGV